MSNLVETEPASSELAGDEMHIHKPKPARSLREFVSEISVIVVGIAIAIAGEQTIEWLHRNAELREARQALSSEMASNAGVGVYSIEEGRCLMGLLDRQIAWAKGGAHAPTGIAGRFPELATSAWEIVKSSVAAHMSIEERLGYSRFYDRVEAMRMYADAGQAVYIRLFGYSAISKLTPAKAQSVLEDSNQARVLTMARSATAKDIIQAAKAMGVNPPPLSDRARRGLSETCALSQEQPASSGRVRPMGAGRSNR